MRLTQFSNRLWIFSVVITLFAFQSSFWASAASVDELKNQRDRLNLRLQAINKEIQALQGQININKKQQATLNNELRLFDTQILSTELGIQAKETQMEDVSLQIQELTHQVERREKELTLERGNLGKLVTVLHELDENSGLQLALGNNTFSAVLDTIEYTSQVQHRIYATLQKIKEVKTTLESQRTERQTQLSELEKLKNSLEMQRLALGSQRGERQKLLDETKGVERNYQKLLSATNAQQDELEKEIFSLDEQVRKSLGQRSISPTSGTLISPMAGVLTQAYGPTTFRALGYSFHNGLDIAAPAGTPIYAAGDGEVTSCDSSNAAYGNWCTIKHNISTKSGNRCIISLYAHMRSHVAKPGQKIKQGELVGYEGNSGMTTRLLYGPHRGYHIHFTIFDCEGFGISNGAHSKTYGAYRVPYGYTYNPASFF